MSLKQLHVTLSLYLFVILCSVGFSASAFAEYSGELADPVAADPTLASIAQSALTAISEKNWWLLASLVISLLTLGLRKGLLAKLLPAAGQKWVEDHPVIGYLTPFVLAAIGGVLTTFASGLPFSLMALVGEVVKVGLGSVGMYIGYKKVAEGRAIAADAKAEVNSKAAALTLLSGGPKP